MLCMPPLLTRIIGRPAWLGLAPTMMQLRMHACWLLFPGQLRHFSSLPALLSACHKASLPAIWTDTPLPRAPAAHCCFVPGWHHSLRTIFDPAAASQMRGSGGSNNNNRRGGAGGGGGGPSRRIVGLDTLNKADHSKCVACSSSGSSGGGAAVGLRTLSCGSSSSTRGLSCQLCSLAAGHAQL